MHAHLTVTAIWTLLLALGLAYWNFRAWRKGVLFLGDYPDELERYDRTERPIAFWSILAVNIAMILAFSAIGIWSAFGDGPP